GAPADAGMEASADIGAQTEPGAPADAGMEASADIGAQTKSGAPADAGMEASAEPLGAYKPAGASAGSGDWAARGRRLIERMEALIAGTDFRPLYDPASKLFSLGFHTTTGEKETILYD